MSTDEELAAAIVVVMDAGFDIMLPGKLAELRAMASEKPAYSERDWSADAFR